MDIIGSIIVGALIGWITGQIRQGRGFGIIGNIIIGLIGGLVGGVLFKLIGLQATSVVGVIISGVIGALLLLFILGTLKKRS